MKAGLFGGDWEDYIQPINDAFDRAWGGIPGPDAGGASPPGPLPGMGGQFQPFAGGSALPADGAAVPSPAKKPGDLALASFDALSGRGDSSPTPDAPAAAPVLFHPQGGANMPQQPASPVLASAAKADTRAPGPAASGQAQAALADRSFVEVNEGYKPQAYLPGPLRNPAPAKGKDPGAGVGITVAAGIDLGAHSVDDLRRWGVSEEGIAALTPMIGLKGDAARNYFRSIQGQIPTVSDADAKAMGQGAFDDTVSKVRQSFDAANPKTRFDKLPPNVRTAIVDLAYQYGTNLAARTPNFWKDITSGDLNAAMGELRNFHDAYPTRRNREADRMQLGIGNGLQSRR